MEWSDVISRAKSYWHYRRHAVSEYRIHSPFVFDLVTRVIYDKSVYPAYEQVESLRKALLKNTNILQVEDHGAGSRTGAGNTRTVSHIAKNSLKPAKYAQLLFRLAQYYKPVKILELGTSLGLTTSYLALSHPNAQVITLEGSPAIAQAARNNIDKLGLKNVTIVTGRFEDNLGSVLKDMGKVDMVFIDGNHQFDPTVQYFDQILPFTHSRSLIVFDDIYWSEEMKSAWNYIVDNQQVKLSIDLYFLGFTFYLAEIRAKEHFIIKY